MEHITTGRYWWFPLLDWGWDRPVCQSYLRGGLGVEWPRSCCTYCPFQAGKGDLDLLRRWAGEPDAAAAALLVEHRSLALNERSMLFGRRSAIDIVRRHHTNAGAAVSGAGAGAGAVVVDLAGVVAAYERLLTATPWSVYEVRRIIHAKASDPARKGTAWRSVRVLATGERGAMRTELDRVAAAAGVPVTLDRHGIARTRRLERGPTFPCVEWDYVVGPTGARTKERPGFAGWWNRLVTTPQLELFPPA